MLFMKTKLSMDTASIPPFCSEKEYPLILFLLFGFLFILSVLFYLQSRHLIEIHKPISRSSVRRRTATAVMTITMTSSITSLPLRIRHHRLRICFLEWDFWAAATVLLLRVSTHTLRNLTRASQHIVIYITCMWRLLWM